MSNLNKIAGALGLLSALLSAAGQAQTCPGSIPPTTPTSRFTIHGDGTVKDIQTGLMWKRCAEGQTGADCTGGAAAAYTWQGALERAREANQNGGFAGHADWRVPNVKELRSIAERRCYGPAVNLDVFPNTPAYWYWSSSPVAFDGGSAWSVSFAYGYDNWDDKGGSGYVRLVRGGQ
jgi:hypothetical protein